MAKMKCQHYLVESASIDLRLDPAIDVVRSQTVDAGADRGKIIDLSELEDVRGTLKDLVEPRRSTADQPFLLEPSDFVLGSTAEHITLSKSYAARVEGKSSLARFGVAVHLTAPKVDPGWDSPLTLEINNFGPFRMALTPYMLIAVLIIERLSSTADEGYSGNLS